MNSPDLADRLRAEALRLGFDRVGIAPAVAPAGFDHFRNWLDQGHAAGMDYLHRHAEARAHPDSILAGVRSVVMVSLIYGRSDPTTPDPTHGKVARYARGEDYHEILWRRLESLLAWLETESPGIQGRAVADSAPLLERDFAQRAGLGWVGKNACLIDRQIGSFTVLGALLVDIDLRPDEPVTRGYCGTCTRCLDLCPTDAFVGPGQLDARRCIGYWTVEHRGTFPSEAPPLDGWVFGCDVCQDVCPWNRKAPPGGEPRLEPRPEWTTPDLLAWLDADPETFRQAIRGTALARAKRSGLVRNATRVLGENRATEAVPALVRRLGDLDPVVRETSAWALGRIGDASVASALMGVANDPDPEVRIAVEVALRTLGIASDEASG